MKHLGLFEGIGGFSLAARWAGWETLAWCEWNEFGQKVLRHHFPEAEGFGDITKTDFTKYANKIDIITGGFPCQPFSLAGKRKGTEDDRHLWPEMLRAIREVKPRWVVGENVYGIVNWDGGLVFEQVQTDLEAEGYEVQSVILPACALNAPHRRDRIWFIAKNSNKDGWGSNEWKEKSSIGQFGDISTRDNERVCPNNEKAWNDTNTNSNGFDQRNGHDEINTSQGGQYALGDIKSLHIEQSTLEHTLCIGQEPRLYEEQSKIAIGEQFGERNARRTPTTNWDNFPTQSPICGGDDGLPTKLDGITFSKWRNESIKAYGNAIVPQVAFEIFKTIIKFEYGL